MLINRTHISHFGLTESPEFVPHKTLLQLTGSPTDCKRVAYYLGLTLNQMRWSDDRTPMEDSFYLVDVNGQVRGQLHIAKIPHIVLYRPWIDGEVTIDREGSKHAA